MIAGLIQRHGWHVLGELAFLAFITVFTLLYLVALFRGRVRAVVCSACGRVASKADVRCPRCQEPLRLVEP